MAESSLETQIDCFLEQFKRSASRAMEERGVVEGSRMSYIDTESPEEPPLPPREEFEMQTTVNLERLNVNDVVDLLKHNYALITGGKSKEGCPIITFPDNHNFQMLSDLLYQRLMLYLTSVPTLQEADMGFHLIIDRRNDKWNAVKAVLLKISAFFPGLIHVVYVLRPAGFLQKAISEVSNKFFKDEFKFRVIVLSTVEELHEYVNPNQLTQNLKGTLLYNHEDWINQRIELESFSTITQQVSTALDEFTRSVEETELPNDVESTHELLNMQIETYSNLKKDILSAAKVGEELLYSIKQKNVQANENHLNVPDTIGNVFAVERLLVQLEETEKTFDDFWQSYSLKLRQCLELRKFEQDFRELQSNFDISLKTVSDMTEVGETVARIDTLIKETKAFEKICETDVQRAEEVISSGQVLLKFKNSCHLECIEPKCIELNRIKEMLMTRLVKRKELLLKCRELMIRIEKANNWCTCGMDLLGSQKIELCLNTPDLAEKYLREIGDFLSSSKEFTYGQKDLKDIFEDSITPETKALVSQVLKRIEDVSLMCDKRVSSLNKIAVKNKRPVQTVIPEPAVPREPPMGAPTKAVLKKAYTIPKMESSNEKESQASLADSGISSENDDVSRIKRGHILEELLQTEKVYVQELQTIIKGYKKEAELEENQSLLPANANEKFDVIFGNLEEIYSFHSKIFLRDLENCISSTELVALCFVQKRENFYQLYSFYCQNHQSSVQVLAASRDLSEFFKICQLKLGHKLPLAAYLLKPVQRLPKYKLMLVDLLNKSSVDDSCFKELKKAKDYIETVLKCVNDNMHQISITGFPGDLFQQGELLLQGSFTVQEDAKKRLKPFKSVRRHLFLYQKALVFCKPVSKAERNKASYQYKHHLNMSEIQITEYLKGESKKYDFEVRLHRTSEVYTIQARNMDQKNAWTKEIKKVLFDQFEQEKREKHKEYEKIRHRPIRQTTSWDTQIQNQPVISTPETHQIRSVSCDSEPQKTVYIPETVEPPENGTNGTHITNDTHGTNGTNATKLHVDEANDCLEGGSWTSDDSEDEEHLDIPRGRYLALADYCAVGTSEINMKEGDIVELLKVGCAGWWFVKVIETSVEGWAPAAYLESLSKKSYRCGSRSQDRLNEH